MFAERRSHQMISRRRGARTVGPLFVACLVALATLSTDALAAQLPVPLRAADSFAVLAGQTVTNVGFSTVNGDLGVSPGTAVTGFPPGTVNGTIHAGDPAAAAAQADLTTAYNDAAGRTPPIALPADAGGMTLAPGVYKSGAALGLTGTVTLDGQGDPNAVFVFQVGSALTTAVESRVNIINGAQPCNVFWQIGSSATLGTSSVFAGNILALSSISMNDGVTLNGRALARNGSVTLINDTITAPHCAATSTLTPTPDVTPPNAGSLAGDLIGLTRDWTNRQGSVDAIVSASDDRIGVAKVEVLAQRVAGGSITVLGSNAVDCGAGCGNVIQHVATTLDRTTLPEDGRYQLGVRVTDRAGNQRGFASGEPLKIDRAAPTGGTQHPVFEVAGRDAIRLYLKPGRDPQEGSGLGDFVISYYPRRGASSRRFVRARAGEGPMVRYQSQQYRAVVLRGVDLERPIEVTAGGCDRARYGQARPEYGGESANCSSFARVRSAQASSRRAPCQASVSLHPIDRTWQSPGRGTVDEPNAAAAARGYLTCEKGVKAAGYYKLTLKPTGVDDIEDPPKTLTVKSGALPNLGATRTLEFDCVPGRRTYRATVVYVLVGNIVGTFVAFRGETFRCNEAGMWRFRSWKSSTPQRPSVKLAKALGPRPGPGNVAHHIIPTYFTNRGAPKIEGRGYACRIVPNSVINGIYLPKKVHNRVHNFRHYAWIYDTLNRYRALGRNGNCNYSNARNAMAHIKRTMATGTFPGSGGSG